AGGAETAARFVDHGGAEVARHFGRAVCRPVVDDDGTDVGRDTPEHPRQGRTLVQARENDIENGGHGDDPRNTGVAVKDIPPLRKSDGAPSKSLHGGTCECWTTDLRERRPLQVLDGQAHDGRHALRDHDVRFYETDGRSYGTVTVFGRSRRSSASPSANSSSGRHPSARRLRSDDAVL